MSSSKPPYYNLVLSVALIITLVGMAALWVFDVKARVFPPASGVIGSGVLFRNGKLSLPTADTVLKDYASPRLITILQASDSPNAAQPLATAAETRHLTHTLLTPIPQGYADAIEAIVLAERESNPTFVHAPAGPQHVAPLIAAYQLLIKRIPQDQVLANLKPYHPNPEVFAPWLTENLPPITQALITKGLLRSPSTVPQH